MNERACTKCLSFSHAAADCRFSLAQRTVVRPDVARQLAGLHELPMRDVRPQGQRRIAEEAGPAR